MSSEIMPTALERLPGSKLRIAWSDGTRRIYTAAGLRKACPCATCREKKSGEGSANPMLLPVLSMSEAQPLEIENMRPVGNYAYNLAFSDGHDSGIFTFDYLSNLGELE